MILIQLCHRQTAQVTALKGTRHSVHYRITTQLTSHSKTKCDNNPLLQLHWDSHLYPFHGRLNQNKNHSMKKGNKKVKRNEKKRKDKVFFTLQVINWLLIGCSHLKLTEWRQGTSPALWNAFLRMGRKIIFFYLCHYMKLPIYSNTVRVIWVNKTVKTQLSESKR